jgi:hypothetical protein
MNYIILFILLIIILVIIYISYCYLFKNVEQFNNINNIKGEIIDNKRNEYINNGLLKYYGSLFDQINGHCFVFKNTQNKLQGLGNPVILSNIYDEGITSDDKAKLYNNHESFCLLKDGKIYSFGFDNYGGTIPQEIKNTVKNKTITQVFSTESAFCALDSSHNIYCWGNSSNGGSIPSELNNEIQGKVKKVFSNKNTFMVIYGTNNKLATWGNINIKLNQVLNTIIVYSNENSIIALYKDSNDVNKVKCFAKDSSFILNSNNVEGQPISNVKCVYTNEQSIIVLYGSDNKLAVCGNESYHGDKSEIEKLENIVNVVSNIGAYCLLKYDGTIYNFGLSQYIRGFPSSNTNFKIIHSSYGVFVGIKNDNSAVIWGRGTHGYNEFNTDNNIIEDVKDVYFNGNKNGGSVLLVKNNEENIVCRGNSSYWGDNDININSSHVVKVLSNTKAFFIITNDNKLHAFGVNDFIKGYEEPINVAQSGLYSNDYELENKYKIDFDNDLDVIDDGYPSPTTNESDSSSTTSASDSSSTTSASDSSTTTQAGLKEDEIYNYFWSLNNNTSVVTNNDNNWDISNSNDVNYSLLQEKIFAKISDSNNIIEFNNTHALLGNKLSISFNIYINDLESHYNILTLDNLIIKVQDNSVKLIKGNTTVRTLNVNKTITNLVFIFTEDNVKVYTNGEKIEYNTQTPNIYDNNNNTELKIGSDSNRLDSPDFYIADLRIIDNYELTESQIREVLRVPNSDISVRTNKVVQTMATQENNQETKTTVSSIIGEQNFIVLSILENKNNLFLKTKRHDNINFIIGQQTQNIEKITNILKNIQNHQINFNLTKEIVINKTDTVTYRGLKFTNGAYTNIINSKLFILFTLDIPSINKVMKLKYLDISTIYKLYNSQKQYGELYFFIHGIKTQKLSVINDAKQTIYFIIYKDLDGVYRFEQIKVDLDYFYKQFNNNYTEMFVTLNTPDTIKPNFIRQFYDNLVENTTRNYQEILHSENNKELFNSIVANVYTNRRRSNVITLFNTKKINNNKCSFNPMGDTIFECKQMCINNYANNSCNELQCNNLCDNCLKDECKWNYSKQMNEQIFRPDKSVIKGFSGDKMIKVTWIKPSSKSTLIKYYIILTTPSNPEFIEVYSFEDTRELPEYIIDELDNEKRYFVSLVSKNQMGVSDISNVETIVPNVGNEFGVERKDSYDNSLQNKEVISSGSGSLKIQKSIYEKHTAINDLKEILKNELEFSKPIGAYDINIF